MDKEEFADALAIVHELFPDMVVMEAMNRRGDVESEPRMTPVGLAILTPHETRHYPHFEWFPWATMQNKLEAGVRFFAKNEKPMIIAVSEGSDVFRYVRHLQKYGLIQKIGTSENWNDGKTAIFENKVTR